jgi:hypothetical protein
LSFTYVHAQMKNKRVVMNEFKSKSADILLLLLLFLKYWYCYNAREICGGSSSQKRYE